MIGCMRHLHTYFLLIVLMLILQIINDSLAYTYVLACETTFILFYRDVLSGYLI